MGALASSDLAQEQLADRWLKASPAAAREWITNTDQLPPAARHRILARRTQSYYD